MDLWNRDSASVRISSAVIGDRDGVATSEWQVQDFQGEYKGTMELDIMGRGEKRKPGLTRSGSMCNRRLWGQLGYIHRRG